jgi:DNA-directed RNA polymerase sigma subunit (sigma70/sigma32)
MAVWLIPALKAVLPHLGTIISAALPAFTKRKTDAVANQTLLLQQQIAELQSAASQNAAHIKELAEQLQGTVAALEHAASMAQANLRRVFLICLVAMAFSAVALCVALFVILVR